MKNYICIHGHFYQPPRENPWLEAIETQDSAAPYHDWNERITAECYAPNQAARLLDTKNQIVNLIVNYRYISFNFGPTLLSWLEKEAPSTYAAIIAADRASCELHNGHGAALAQAWGHTILPLANARDKSTQILWGLRDFTTRFGRPPEGMWLPEAAVDLESLELLAAAGIRFTILSPFQARRTRRLGATEWHDLHNGEIDTRHPYLCRLPSGGSIAIFFYEGNLARDVAFGGLLNSGDAFAQALKAPGKGTQHAQLTHIATDGESYGHHHHFGEMALARAIDLINADKNTQLTVYGAYLAAYPPQEEVEIIPLSSWSCAHGVERWRNDCGCRIGSDPAWNQKWRAPLRDAFDQLRDRLIPLFETFAGRLFPAPWSTRDAYIEVILDRSPEKVKSFLTREAGRTLTAEEERRALQLLEMNRHAMQMYTSCGWFFDEVSGIETVQLLTYAARAIDLARNCCAVDLDPEFRAALRLVPSNLPRWQNAEKLYREEVLPQVIDLRRVAANYAIILLLGGTATGRIHCYEVSGAAPRRISHQRAELIIGQVCVRSAITREEITFDFAALHFGDLQVLAGVRAVDGNPIDADIWNDLSLCLFQGDVDGAIALLKSLFNNDLHTLTHLFKDERQESVKRIISSQIAKILDEFRTIYQDHLGLLRFLHKNALPIPAPLSAAAEQLLNEDILQRLNDNEAVVGRIRALLDDARECDLKLDQRLLTHAASRRSRTLMENLAAWPDDRQHLYRAIDGITEILVLPWPLDLWQAQNLYFEVHRNFVPGKSLLSRQGDKDAEVWLDRFRQLGALLGIKIPEEV